MDWVRSSLAAKLTVRGKLGMSGSGGRGVEAFAQPAKVVSILAIISAVSKSPITTRYMRSGAKNISWKRTRSSRVMLPMVSYSSTRARAWSAPKMTFVNSRMAMLMGSSLRREMPAFTWVLARVILSSSKTGCMRIWPRISRAWSTSSVRDER